MTFLSILSHCLQRIKKIGCFTSPVLSALGENKSKLVLLAILISITLVIFRVPLIKNGHIVHEDSNFPWSRELLDKRINWRLSSWDAYTLLGEHHVLNNDLSVLLLISFLNIFVDSVPIAVKLLYIVVLGISAISMYFFISRLLKNDLSAFISALFYILNPWVFDRFLSGHLNILIAYSLMPVALLFIIKFGRASLKHKILASLFCGIILRTNWHLGIFLILIMILFVTYKTLLNRLKFETFLSEGTTIVLILGLAALMNIDWLPSTLSGGPEFIGSYFPPIEEFYALSKNSGILNVLMFNSYWAQSVENLFTNFFGKGVLYSIWQLSPFIILTSAFLPLPLVRVNRSLGQNEIRLYYFFVLIFLLGVILSNGAKSPFGALNIWLYRNFPFFALFRDPNKFAYLMIISTSVMLGISVTVLRKIKMRFSKCSLNPGKIGAFVMISLIFLNSGVALVSLTPPHAERIALQTVVLPEEYEEIYKLLGSDPAYPCFRIAILPPFVLREKFSWSELYIPNPLLSVPPVGFIITHCVRNPSFAHDYAWHVFRLLYMNKTTKIGSLFAPLSVKYFIVQEDAEPLSLGNTQIFLNKEEAEILNNQEDLELIYAKGTIKIYKNLAYVPKITTTVEPLMAMTDRIGQTLLYQLSIDVPSKNLIFPDGNFVSTPILLSISQYLFIQEEHKWDLLFNLLDQKYIIDFYKLARKTQDAKNNWIAGEYSNLISGLKKIGDLDFVVNKFIYTRGVASVKAFVDIDEDGDYEVWLNRYVGPESGNLSLRIGDEEFTITSVDDMNSGFIWVNYGNITLKKEKYEVEICSDGPNAVSKVAIIPKYVLENVIRYSEDIFQDKTVIYLGDGVDLNKISPFIRQGKSLYAYHIEKVISSSPLYDIIWNLTEVNDFYFKPVNINYTYSVSGDALRVDCYFDGPPEEDEFLVMWKKAPNIDLMVYPNLSLTYRVEDPSVQFVEMGFSIDFTGDGKADKTIWMHEKPRSADWHTYEINLYEHAKKEHLNAEEYKLVSVNILPHKIWGIDTSGEKKGNYSFYLRTLQMTPSIVTNVTKHVQLYMTGSYNFWIRARSYEEPQPINVQIAGNELTASINESLEWVFLGRVELEKGSHEIVLRSDGTVKVFEMIPISEANSDFKHMEEPEITFKMLTAYKYVIDVRASNPFFLIFSETYHDGWKAFINGKEQISDEWHFVVNSFANGWYID